MIIVTTPFVTCQECGNQVQADDAVKFHRVEDAGYTDKGKHLLRATGETVYECKPCYKACNALEDAQYAAENE